MTDEVNHPPHYNSGKIEVIDYIEDQRLGFNLGNVVKYISRAGKKGESKHSELKDLLKARWYLERHISRVEAEFDSLEIKAKEVRAICKGGEFFEPEILVVKCGGASDAKF